MPAGVIAGLSDTWPNLGAGRRRLSIEMAAITDCWAFDF